MRYEFHDVAPCGETFEQRIGSSIVGPAPRSKQESWRKSTTAPPSLARLTRIGIGGEFVTPRPEESVRETGSDAALFSESMIDFVVGEPAVLVQRIVRFACGAGCSFLLQIARSEELIGDKRTHS